MKSKIKIGPFILAATACCMLVLTALAQSKDKTQVMETSRASVLSLELGRKLPLSVQSHPIEWKGHAYHLISLGSIQFELDQTTSRLKAEIQGGVTTFDDVSYDISAAVFDARGALLGTARTECKVERLWLGKVLATQQTLTLDFGNSLDYANATGFMINISRCKVLTPDDWQAK